MNYRAGAGRNVMSAALSPVLGAATLVGAAAGNPARPDRLCVGISRRSSGDGDCGQGFDP